MALPRRLLLLSLFVAGSPALAADVGTPGEPLSLQIHGFVSQGFILSTGSNYLARSKRGSFELTEVGINFTMPLTDRLRAGIQLFARDLGPIGNYTAKADWFYLDYRFKDWLGLRAGRVKLPFGLYNDTSDVDAARIPVLLPQSLYPITSRDFLLALTGGEVYGFIDLASAGALDYSLYGGTIFIEVPPTPGSPFVIVDLSVPYVVGGRLMWETPIEGLRLGGSLQGLRLDTDLLMGTMPLSFQIEAILWVASIEYAAKDLLLAVEYSRWPLKVRSSDQTIFPDNDSTSERAYAMAGYRLAMWLQLGAYYSLLFPDVSDRSGREAMQHDVAATARFDINSFWLVKLEAHYLNGTAALSPSLNDNRPRSELARDWGVFLVKTTAYF